MDERYRKNKKNESLNPNVHVTDESVTIEYDQADFKAIGEYTIMTYGELAELINQTYRHIFKDYSGCKLEYSQLGFEFLLEFNIGANNGIGELTAIESVDSTIRDAKNVADAMISMSRLYVNNSSTYNYEVTSDAKDVLKGLFGEKDPNNIRWSDISSVNTGDDAYYRVSTWFYDIHHINVSKLLSILFDGGDKYQYKIVVSDINNHGILSMRTPLKIERVSLDDVKMLENKCAPLIMPQNRMDVIRSY